MFQFKWYPLVALCIFQGALSQSDYTITLLQYTASSDGTTVNFQGDFDIPVSYGTADYVYSQEFFSVVEGVCTSTPVSASAFALQAGGSNNTLAATFGIDLASAPATVYQESIDGSTGTITLCHRLKVQVQTGGLLMNQVDTIVTATVDLAAEFTTAVAVSTTPSTVGNEEVADSVSLTGTVNAVASPETLTAGQVLTVELNSSTNFILANATLSDGTEVAPTPDSSKLLASHNCGTSTPSCQIQITLGFASYFASSTSLTLSGEVNLDLGARRRLEEGIEQAPFQVTFRTLEYTESGATLEVVWGGAMVAAAALALV